MYWTLISHFLRQKIFLSVRLFGWGRLETLYVTDNSMVIQNRTAIHKLLLKTLHLLILFQNLVMAISLAICCVTISVRYTTVSRCNGI